MIPFAVLINGKVRFWRMVPGGVLRESAEAMARGIPQISNRISGRTIPKTSFTRNPDRALMNFVL